MKVPWGRVIMFRVPTLRLPSRRQGVATCLRRVYDGDVPGLISQVSVRVCHVAGGQTRNERFMMDLKKMAAGAVIAGALGLPTLSLGVGLGTASADPGQCWMQNCQGDQRGDGGDRRGPDQWQGDQWRPDQRDGDQWGPDQHGWDQRPWDQRGVDDARFDHQPFNWQGQRVEPYWDQDRGAWGFWFLGAWIPL